MVDVPTAPRIVHQMSAYSAEELIGGDPEYSETLLRLAILRDDFVFELKELHETPDDAVDTLWLSTYFLRRVSSTVSEFRNVFLTELKSFMEKDDIPSELNNMYLEARSSLEQAADAVKKFRSVVGVHIRPEHGLKEKLSTTPEGLIPENSTLTSHVLKRNRSRNARIILSNKPFHGSLRGISNLALFVAWPEIDSQQKFEEKVTEFDELIRPCWDAISVVDHLFLYLWQDKSEVREFRDKLAETAS